MKHCAFAVFLLYAFQLAAQPITAKPVSVSASGRPGDSASFKPTLSFDGRYAAFSSWSRNLIDGTLSESGQIYVHDRDTGKINKISVSPQGADANESCSHPVISSDGRFVAFTSSAGNLVPADPANGGNLYLYDREARQVSRVKGTCDGDPVLSADARYIAFPSAAVNLVAGDTNIKIDIFVYDRVARSYERISLKSDGSEADKDSSNPSISADGRFVAFETSARLLPQDSGTYINIYVYDRQTRSLELLPGSYGYFPAVSGNGRYVAFQSGDPSLVPGDTNDQEDIFVYDRDTHEVERVSVSSAGVQANDRCWQPAISNDGTIVMFYTPATSLVAEPADSATDVFVRNRRSGTTRRVNVGSGGQSLGEAHDPALSADGRYAAFTVLQAYLAALDDYCPDDPDKVDGGQCGCGVVDTDQDGDGTADCTDACPADPHKDSPGACGCGRADEDLDGDGRFDCLEAPELKQQVTAGRTLVKSLKAKIKAPGRAETVQQLRELIAALAATKKDSTFSLVQRSKAGAAARALQKLVKAKKTKFKAAKSGSNAALAALYRVL